MFKPLSEAETGQYIEHRLKIAGANGQIFKPDAIHEIYRIAQGYPRAINILCDHALLTGYASGVPTIDSTIVTECENELNIEVRKIYSFPNDAHGTPQVQPAPQNPSSRPHLNLK